MSGTRVYCIYCDHRYLPRAMTLIASLRHHGCGDPVWLFALTEECRGAALALDLPGVRVLSLADLETTYPEMLRVKPGRTMLEYYYTCSPMVMDYAMKNMPQADSVTYLDSDLAFFEDPSCLFDEIGAAPVAIIPHNFPKRLQALERFGRYNVGWVTFKRSAEGIRCLEWWRDSCLEWCFGYQDGERWGDQGYLNRFIEIAPNTKVLTHKGCNTAPWNIENYDVTVRQDKVLIDEDPLIFFHFQGVYKALGSFYFDSHRAYGAPLTGNVRNFIYKPYVTVLHANEERLAQMMPSLDMGRAKLRGKHIFGLDIRNLRRTLIRAVFQLVDLVAGRPIWQSRVS